MKVLLFGASGFLGSALLPRLLNDSRVTGVTAVTHHRPLSLSCASPKCTSLTMDDFFRSETAIGKQSFDVVICLCGRTYSQTSDDAVINDSNLDIPIKVIDYCKTVGAGHIILASSINARLSAEKYNRRYALCKQKVEAYLGSSGLSYTIFRPALIFGVGDAGFARLVEYIQKHSLVPVFGDGQKLKQPIHVDEAAEFFHQAMFTSAQNAIFEIGGFKAMTYDDMLLKIASALGRRISLWHIPLRPLYFTIACLDHFGLKSPVNSEQLLHIDTHLAIDNTPALRLYSVTLKPFEEWLPLSMSL